MLIRCFVFVESFTADHALCTDLHQDAIGPLLQPRSTTRVPRSTAENCRLLVQATRSHALFLVDLDGRIASWDEGAERFALWRRDEAIGKPFATLYSAADAIDGRPTRDLDTAVREGSCEGQGWRMRKGGSRVWAEFAVTAARDPMGRVIAFAVVARDVTIRRRAEEALHMLADASAVLSRSPPYDPALKKLASLLVPRLGDACLIQLCEGDAMVTVAEAREQVRDEGAPVGPACSPACPACVEVPMQGREGRVGVITLWSRHGSYDSRDRQLLHHIAARAALAVEHARLVEDQHRANERLRLLADAGTRLDQSLEIEATLETLARLAIEWFADECLVRVMDEGHVVGDVVAASDPGIEKAMRRVLDRYKYADRYPGAEGGISVWRPPPWLRQALQSRQACLVGKVDEPILRSLAVDAEHLEQLRELGIASIVVVPLVARGVRIGVAWLARSRVRPYDADDLGLAEEFGRRAALAVDNARLFKRANVAVSMRDEFLSIAGHELNTPLTPLKILLDGLSRGKIPADRQGEKLEAASRQVARLARLVTELLDVSRITGGRVRIEKDTFDLAALIDEVMVRLKDEADRAGTTLTSDLTRPCHGSWDRMRLDQVVTNLLSNAIKYGGGKPIDVRLQVAPEGRGRVRLVVRDRGIGIEQQHQRRIFERFERAVSAQHYGGFGLGLWIARQVVEASGGAITVESAPGLGSTFTVELPREDVSATGTTGVAGVSDARLVGR